MVGDIEVGGEAIHIPSAASIPGYLEGGGLMAKVLTHKQCLHITLFTDRTYGDSYRKRSD